jgi:hypothetical protein
MKIALCLSGFMRNFTTTYANLREHLLRHHDVDVFIHTWDIQDANTPHLHIVQDKTAGLYQAKHMVVEPFATFTINPIVASKNFDKARNPNNVISMQTKIKACNDLCAQYAKNNNIQYDCVIRLRPDVNLKSTFIIDKAKLNQINVPQCGDFGGLNDQIAYSNPANMSIYANLINSMESYLEHDQVFLHPELLLQHHLVKHNIKVGRFDLDYTLLCHGIETDNKVRDRSFNFERYLQAIRVVKYTKDNKTYYTR